MHHGQRVALQRHGAEDIELVEAAFHACSATALQHAAERGHAGFDALGRHGDKAQAQVLAWPPCGKKAAPGT
jgi:hypothetical protein